MIVDVKCMSNEVQTAVRIAPAHSMNSSLTELHFARIFKIHGVILNCKLKIQSLFL